MKTHEAVDEALRALSARLEAPRALEIDAELAATLRGASERARQQLVEELPPVLVVALCGGTGVGKSTLINALAGGEIAEASAERPTTTHIRVYHHRDVELGGLPSAITYGARFVAHEREELRHKVLVDTPDLDSFVREHRERTLRLLKSAGLVLWVFSPEKYLEERTWSVLREERRFSASAAVLNKVDGLAPGELDAVTEDLGRRLEDAGLGKVRIFRTNALAHTADRAPGSPGAGAAVDETPALAGLIERELKAGDATRIARESRRRAFEHLRASVERAGSPALLETFAALRRRTIGRAPDAGDRLVELLSSELREVESELLPLATLRQHERFHGPFRAWLALCDFLTIGLTGVVDRMVGRPARGTSDVLERTLCGAREDDVDALFRAEERAIGDELYAAGLPVGRWRRATRDRVGARVLTDLARELRERFESRATVRSTRARGLVWVVSQLGGLVPAAIVLGGLYLLARDLWSGAYTALAIVAHLVLLCGFFFLALSGIVAVLMPVQGRLGRGLALAAARDVVPRALERWLDEYEADLAADVDDLAGPLATLAAALELELGAESSDGSHRPIGDEVEGVAWPEPAGPEEPIEVGAADAPGEPEAPRTDAAEELLRALRRNS